MAKKEKVPLQYSDDLEAVDAELAAAMEMLDEANGRIDGLLKSIDIVVPAQAAEGQEQSAPPAEPATQQEQETVPDGPDSQ